MHNKVSFMQTKREIYLKHIIVLDSLCFSPDFKIFLAAVKSENNILHCVSFILKGYFRVFCMFCMRYLSIVRVPIVDSGPVWSREADRSRVKLCKKLVWTTLKKAHLKRLLPIPLPWSQSVSLGICGVKHCKDFGVEICQFFCWDNAPPRERALWWQVNMMIKCSI